MKVMVVGTIMEGVKSGGVKNIQTCLKTGQTDDWMGKKLDAL